MNYEEISALDSEHGMQNYARYKVAFSRGNGSRLYDTDGKEYIDFASGIGVISIGHSNPYWVEAVSRQAGQLAHVSNLFYTEPTAKLASRLTVLSGMKAVFFGNSGAEVNEGAIKLARKYSYDKYGKNRATILTLEQSFHGRTMATLTATGQESFHEHFFPFLPGFRYLPPNDLAALQEALTPDVCAIMVEGIQGEGGVLPLEVAYVEALAKLTKEKDILLIFDEVQTGNGRTGVMYSYQGFGILPDVVTTAKGLGGGVPIGALMVGDTCRNVLSAGTHGSTFGANAICCAGANAVLDILTAEGFLDQVTENGERIRQEIISWNFPVVKEVRGQGLMLGIVLEGLPPKEAVADLLGRGLVTLTAGVNVLRLLPPLTISEQEIAQGLSLLYDYLK